MSEKLIKWVALQQARASGIDPKTVVQALWDRIDLRDEVLNRYPF
jgi:hypothetical protein